MKIRPVCPRPSNGFTPGRDYEVVGREGSLLTVVNDNGHVRHVCLNAPSPHLVVLDDSYLGQRVAGHFEEVTNE